ncbi:hypothetical protein FA09DRAFT_331913 [Tilletiopsis washingtonensis]|jgi:hypothetical protein|uniref:Uncharacterized protein n=1 Tax=Tilletiopsis washingtonensis TaxID=58919 RepID=A0A316Z205_9BASI|nr:hypothetical protein FA09DRAFT_331913 [Tilletiopsis washingtonensis]PWN95589.1 hypothetical protein FA09DRAFT_331913 [Tilletiopsis washingtonensis]
MHADVQAVQCWTPLNTSFVSHRVYRARRGSSAQQRGRGRARADSRDSDAYIDENIAPSPFASTSYGDDEGWTHSFPALGAPQRVNTPLVDVAEQRRRLLAQPDWTTIEEQTIGRPPLRREKRRRPEPEPERAVRRQPLRGARAREASLLGSPEPEDKRPKVRSDNLELRESVSPELSSDVEELETAAWPSRRLGRGMVHTVPLSALASPEPQQAATHSEVLDIALAAAQPRARRLLQSLLPGSHAAAPAEQTRRPAFPVHHRARAPRAVALPTSLAHERVPGLEEAAQAHTKLKRAPLFAQAGAAAVDATSSRSLIRRLPPLFPEFTPSVEASAGTTNPAAEQHAAPPSHKSPSADGAGEPVVPAADAVAPEPVASLIVTVMEMRKQERAMVERCLGMQE